MTGSDAAALLKRYRGSLTQIEIAAELSRVLGRLVRQGQVSDHLRGEKWTFPDLPLAYCEVLDIPHAEMARAWGFDV